MLNVLLGLYLSVHLQTAQACKEVLTFTLAANGDVPNLIYTKVSYATDASS